MKVSKPATGLPMGVFIIGTVVTMTVAGGMIFVLRRRPADSSRDALERAFADDDDRLAAVAAAPRN